MDAFRLFRARVVRIVGDVPSWEFLALASCVVGSAFFSASETALTAMGDARTRQIVEAANGRHLLRLWLNRPQQVLATLLVANTAVNIGASGLAVQIATQLGLPHGVSIATGVMTLVILIFGEVTPKTLARQKPEALLKFLMPFVYLFSVVLYPFGRLMVAITSRVVGQSKQAPTTTAEEIEYLINLGTREGVLDEVKQQLLNSVLEFADLLVKEIMVPRTRVVALERTATYDQVMRLVGESEHSRLPVFEDSVDNILGVVNVKDLLKDGRSPTNPGTFKIDTYLRPSFFVPELMKISRLLKEFQRRKTHLAIVVDEFGGTSGIVTLEDVVEEIVGEIQDEHDAEERPIRQTGPGRYIADGSANIRELEEFLKVSFPEDGDYETLGGFLTATAGKVPSAGARVAWNGFCFAVRAGDERRVLKVEIQRSPEEKPVADSEGNGNTRALKVASADIAPPTSMEAEVDPRSGTPPSLGPRLVRTVSRPG